MAVKEVRTLTGTGWNLKGNQAAFGQCGLVGDWWNALELHFVLDGPPPPAPASGGWGLAGRALCPRGAGADSGARAGRAPADHRSADGRRGAAAVRCVGAGRGQSLEHGAARVRGHDGAEAGAADGGGAGALGDHGPAQERGPVVGARRRGAARRAADSRTGGKLGGCGRKRNAQPQGVTPRARLGLMTACIAEQRPSLTQRTAAALPCHAPARARTRPCARTSMPRLLGTWAHQPRRAKTWPGTPPGPAEPGGPAGPAAPGAPAAPPGPAGPAADIPASPEGPVTPG